MKVKAVLFLFLSTISVAFAGKSDVLNRIESHFLLEDYRSALMEAEEGMKLYSDSLEINKYYLRSLMAIGDDEKVLSILNSLPENLKGLNKDGDFLEEIAWGVLKKGFDSSQYAIRLSAVVGAYFTRDAKSVDVFLKMMDDSNAILRAVAVQLSVNYRDEPLKEKIMSLLETEKVWIVRLELLKAVGQMKIKEKSEYLKQMLKNERATYEERVLAIESLVSIYEDISFEEVETLLKSPYAGFRSLGCFLATHFEVKEAKDLILDTVFDSRDDVRISALNSIAFFFRDYLERESLIKALRRSYKDTNAFVSITASWIGVIINEKEGSLHLRKWLFDKYEENRRFAAGAVAQLGKYGIPLAEFALKNSKDLFVKANVALGLLGQRKKVKDCCDILFEFIKNKDRLWMWERQHNSYFNVIAPSEIRHTDQLPNYPQAIDQTVQLNILSLLAIVEDNRAQDAIKMFLKQKTWGITGLAAITLLQEGDEDCLKLLRTFLQDTEKDIKVQAALALAIIGKDQSALPILEEAYFHASHDMKLNILGAIGNASNNDSLPFLVKVMQEPFSTIKIAVATAIIQIVNL